MDHDPRSQPGRMNLQHFVVLVVAIFFATETRGECFGERFLLATTTFKNITSPGYPANYSSNLNCSWRVAVDGALSGAGYVVKIVVVDLDLERSTNCNYDSLSLYDGATELSPRLAHLCGFLDNLTFYSNGDSIYIWFHSDVSDVAKGFLISYSAVRLPTAPPLPATHTRNCTNGSNNTLYALVNDEQFIDSPDYPKFLPTNFDCRWLITAPYQTRIRLSLRTLVPCRLDSLSVYDSDTVNATRLLGNLCVNKRAWYSTGRFLLLVFRTFPMTIELGYRLGYQALPHPPTDNTNSSIGIWTCSENGVTTVYAKPYDTGYIESPNYPKFYPNDFECSLQIFASDGYIVRITILDFHLEANTDCTYDSLSIYDGTYNRRLARLCGNSPTSTFMSTGRSMLLVFKTDIITNFKGFFIGFVAVPYSPTTTKTSTSSPCGLETVYLRYGEGSRYIQSPSYPQLYPNDVQCTWSLTTVYPYVIHVHVEDMDMETTYNCRYDSVTLYNSDNSELPTKVNQIAQLCSSSSIGFDYYSDLSHMYIVFTTDLVSTRRGFRFSVNAVKVEDVQDQTSASSGSNVNVGGILVGVILFVILVFFSVWFIFVRRWRLAARCAERQASSRRQNSFGRPTLTPATSPAYTTNFDGGHINHVASSTPDVYDGPPAYTDLQFDPVSSPQSHGNSSIVLSASALCRQAGGTRTCGHAHSAPPADLSYSKPDCPPPPYQEFMLTAFPPARAFSSPQPTTVSPQPTTDSPQPTTDSPQPTIDSPQPTTDSPQPTTDSPTMPNSAYSSDRSYISESCYV